MDEQSSLGIFRTLQQLHAPITHYKICSTFDSAPHIGNIGRALEMGREVFAARYVPIVVAAPHLGRYVLFGNLFAAARRADLSHRPASDHAQSSGHADA